jgi:hypothetical protein
MKMNLNSRRAGALLVRKMGALAKGQNNNKLKTLEGARSTDLSNIAINHVMALPLFTATNRSSLGSAKGLKQQYNQAIANPSNSTVSVMYFFWQVLRTEIKIIARI